MTRLKTYVLVLLCIILSRVSVFGNDSYRFYHLSVEEGLSQNTILSITQDLNGNMWFATYDGIDQYDGYNFKSYKIEQQVRDRQFNRIDPRLLCDSKGTIWVTTGALSFYDPSENRFLVHEEFKQYTVIDFTEIESKDDNYLLLATDCGLRVLGLSSERQVPDFLNETDAIALYAKNDTLIVATSEGFLRAFSLTSVCSKVNFPHFRFEKGTT